MKSPVRLGVSPAASSPRSVFSQRLWGFISLYWNPGLCSLFRSLVVPPSLSTWECGTTSSASHRLARPGPLATALPRVLSTQLPISAPPTSLEECFFFNSFVVGLHTVPLSVSSGCCLFLNLLLSFFWLCKEAQCVYVRHHLGWKFCLLCLKWKDNS